MKDLPMNFFRVSPDPALTQAYAELQKLAQRWAARAAVRAYFAPGGVGGLRAHGASGNASQRVYLCDVQRDRYQRPASASEQGRRR